MIKISYILFIIIGLLFYSCRRQVEPTHYPYEIHSPSALMKQFNFKKDSKWKYKNTITNTFDSIQVFSASGIESYTVAVTVKDHLVTYESFYLEIDYSMFPTVGASLMYTGNDLGIIGHDTYFSKEMGMGLFEKNAGDSVLYNNNTTWNKIEHIHSTIFINGHTYSNVYEMSYHPYWYGFSKIWWCPSIGFVKLEGTNAATNQFGSWELDSYNVQLF